MDISLANACLLIRKCGVLLDLPQTVIGCGCIVFHRYCYRAHPEKAALPGIARASLFIGCKLEEFTVAIRDVVCSFHFLLMAEMAGTNSGFTQADGDKILTEIKGGRAHPFITEEMPEFWTEKSETIRTESEILIELGFMCFVETPHKFVLSFCNMLKVSERLCRRALEIVNDALLVPLAAQMKPGTLATGAIYVASRLVGEPLPEREDPGNEVIGDWWDLFPATKQDIDTFTETMEQLYSVMQQRYGESEALSGKLDDYDTKDDYNDGNDADNDVKIIESVVVEDDAANENTDNNKPDDSTKKEEEQEVVIVSTAPQEQDVVAVDPNASVSLHGPEIKNRNGSDDSHHHSHHHHHHDHDHHSHRHHHDNNDNHHRDRSTSRNRIRDDRDYYYSYH